MRRISLMLLLLAAALASYAQSGTSSFYISVLDPAYVPTVTGTTRPYTIHFNDPQFDVWVSPYGITDFRRAYSASKMRALKQVYLVTCTDPALMDALQSSYPGAFAGGYEAVPVVPMVLPNDYGKNVWTIKPNNYVSPITGSQTYLDLIKADLAWNYAKGDSTRAIGMVDRMVNRNHPDLKGKMLSTYANNPLSPLDTNEDKHGTMVAGILGAKTNNDTGLAGMAWKNPIANSSDMADSTNLKLSADGIRIINNSWAEQSNNCAATFIDTARGAVQALYNEVYENGSFAVFAAGNGPNPLKGYLCPATTYRYPASWDHNFSVTSVGHFYNVGTTGNAAPYNTKDVHQSLPYQAASHNHNPRVDLCAPGYGMTLFYYSQGSPNDTFQQYTVEEGTSFAAPLVAGTAALMLSAPNKSCLTPYQLEVLLKQSAANISNITANIPYVGQLGAGRLDAEKAMQNLSNMPCNGSVATTMEVSEIKISTLCFNGNSNSPQLSATIKNGTPPYSYRWIPLADNRADLDNYYSATPQVIYLKSNPTSNKVSFLLTVTDNSPVKKVASQHFYAVLKPVGAQGSGYDLGIRDSHFDLLNNINEQMEIDARDNTIWDGPDIWNRLANDNGTNHQDPEFHQDSILLNGKKTFNPLYNYVNIRIKNVGCAPSPATNVRLRAYWSLPSVGEIWPGDWKSNNLIYLGSSLPVGREIDSDVVHAVPVLAPGAEVILNFPWRGIDPKVYDTAAKNAGTDYFHACILARIEESPGYSYGMSTPELQNVNVRINVLSNNNIATRNMNSYDQNINNVNSPAGGPLVSVLVGNADRVKQTFSLTLSNDKADHPHLHGDLSEYLTGTLYLDELWDLWVAGGMRGSGFVQADRETRTIAYDPSVVLRLDNLDLPVGKKFRVRLQFTQRPDARIYEPVTDHIRLRQLLPGAGPDGDDFVYGAVGYELHLQPNVRAPRREVPVALEQAAGDEAYLVFPNPAHGSLTVQRQQSSNEAASVRLIDVTGRMVGGSSLAAGQDAATLPLDGLSAGLYLVEVQGAAAQHRYKVIVR